MPVHCLLEKGSASKWERGVAANYPLVDIRVMLVDGEARSVDSSDIAFHLRHEPIPAPQAARLTGARAAR